MPDKAPAPVTPQNQPKDIYEAASKLNDADYKKFVDAHPHIKGLGYTEAGNKIDRIVSPLSRNQLTSLI